jgi:hypothetical protein
VSAEHERAANPQPTLDPRGVCGTCRFFIDDAAELAQEFKHLSGPSGVVLNTVERVGYQRTVTIGKGEHARTHTITTQRGEALERVALTWEKLAQVLWERYRIDPLDIGLCEKGVARIVTRKAGSSADEHGRRTDQCPKWQERGLLYQIRPADWRERREFELELRDGKVSGRKIGRNEPCPCGAPEKYKDCHGQWLK